MSKTTPGPWKWTHDGDILTACQNVAVLVLDETTDVEPGDRRLIAAAPELLEAVKALCAAATLGDPTVSSVACDEARALIKRIEEGS